MSKEITTQDEKFRPDESLAFSRIKEEIETIAKQKAESIISEANKNAEEILSNAKEQGNLIKSNITDEADRSSGNLKIQEISRKKLSIKMDYLKYRDQLFEEIHVEANSKIQKYTQTTDYKKFLLALAEKSGISIGGGDLYLIVRKEDKTIFSKPELDKISEMITKISGIKTSMKISKDDLKSLGGLKIVRGDQKLFVDNSFEARLERNMDSIRTNLLGLLS